MADRASGNPGGFEYFARTFARAMVIAGTSFWVVAGVALAASSRMSLNNSILTVIWPFLGTLATLLIGWRNERLASLLLYVAAAALLVWGVIYGWEGGLWVVMGYAVIGPMVLAGTFFLLAARARDRREAADETTKPDA